MFESLLKNRDLQASESYYQARRAFEIDPQQDFVRVKNRIGLQGAMIYAQIYFSEQTRYKRFRRELELHPVGINGLNKDFDVMIVLPPRGSIPSPAIKQMLRQSMGLATSAGFAHVSQAQLNSDRVISGAKRLHQLIQEKKRQGRKLILVSHSFGSAFVRVMLDESAEEDLSPIRGWMNFSGLIFGSPLFHCSNKVSWMFKTTSAQRTFSCEQQHFKRPLKHHRIRSLHFLGLQSQLSPREWKLRDRLRAWGPSDGLVPLSHYQKLDQTVVPLLDQGHVIDFRKMSMTFVRSLSSIVSTLPQKQEIGLESQLSGYDFKG